MLTIALLKGWSINYYNETARTAGQAAKDAACVNGGLGDYYSGLDTLYHATPAESQPSHQNACRCALSNTVSFPHRGTRAGGCARLPRCTQCPGRADQTTIRYEFGTTGHHFARYVPLTRR